MADCEDLYAWVLKDQVRVWEGKSEVEAEEKVNAINEELGYHVMWKYNAWTVHQPHWVVGLGEGVVIVGTWDELAEMMKKLKQWGLEFVLDKCLLSADLLSTLKI